MPSLLALVLWLLAPPTPAERLAALHRPATFSARFEQTKTQAAFKTPQQARGRVLVGGPERLRWEYEAPYHMVLVRDAARVSMSYPDLGRKQAFDLDREPQLRAVFDTILFFHTASAEKLAGRFEVTADGPDHYALLPKAGADKLIARIDVDLDPAQGVPKKVRIAEPDGDATELVFSDVEVDQPIPEDLLRP
jgi:outer membrane lipoprotein-sorting protein